MANGFKGVAALAASLTAATVALGGCGVLDAATYHEDRKYELTGGLKALNVRLEEADVEIIGTDGDEVSVHEHLSWTEKLKPEPYHRREGDALVLGYRCPDVVSIGLSRCAVRYRIQVPRAMAATVRTGSGDIRVRGLAGALRAEVSSGDIVATDLRGGPVDASADSGDITVSGAGAVQARTDSGGIDLRDLRGDRARAEADSGTVRVVFAADRPPNLVQATSRSGRVIIKVPADVPYALLYQEWMGDPRITDITIDPNSPRRISARADSGSIDISAS